MTDDQLPANDREFMREVLTRLAGIATTVDKTAERAESSFENSAKARTGNRRLAIAVAIVVIAVVVSSYAVRNSNRAATQARSTVVQLQGIVDQQAADRETSRVGSCQTRNSAQEAGRQTALVSSTAAAVAAITTYNDGITAQLPDYEATLNEILNESVLAAQRAALDSLPKFYDIDTDCNFDAVFTSADYDTIVPDFGAAGAVPVPPERTVPTTQPGG